MIEGRLVGLRAIERGDLETLRAWRNQPGFRRYFREVREIGAENQVRWFEKTVVGDPSTVMFSIVSLEDGELLGCCGLCYINWIQRFADLSLYIGWESSYIDGSGFAEDACRLLFDYGFGELGLHKVWTEIYEFDRSKYELYTGLGFEQDGLLRDNYFHEGEWHNSRILSLLASDWSHAERPI